MAIDTTNKRRAAQNTPWFVILPHPDGTISTADRELTAGFYCGIPASPLSILETDDLDMVSLSVIKSLVSLTADRDKISLTKERDIVEV